MSENVSFDCVFVFVNNFIFVYLCIFYVLPVGVIKDDDDYYYCSHHLGRRAGTMKILK